MLFIPRRCTQQCVLLIPRLVQISMYSICTPVHLQYLGIYLHTVIHTTHVLHLFGILSLWHFYPNHNQSHSSCLNLNNPTRAGIFMSLPLPPFFLLAQLHANYPIQNYKIETTSQGNQTPNSHTKGKRSNHSASSSYRELDNSLPLVFFKLRLLGNRTVYKK